MVSRITSFRLRKQCRLRSQLLLQYATPPLKMEAPGRGGYQSQKPPSTRALSTETATQSSNDTKSKQNFKPQCNKHPSSDLESWIAKVSSNQADLYNVGAWTQNSSTSSRATPADLNKYVDSIAGSNKATQADNGGRQKAPHLHWKPYTPGPFR